MSAAARIAWAQLLVLGGIGEPGSEAETDLSVRASTEAIARRNVTESRAAFVRTEGIARRLTTEAK